MPGLIEYFTARKISTWERKGGWDYYNWEGNTPGERAMAVLPEWALSGLGYTFGSQRGGSAFGQGKHHDTSGSGFRVSYTIFCHLFSSSTITTTTTTTNTTTTIIITSYLSTLIAISAEQPRTLTSDSCNATAGNGFFP